MSPDPGSVPGTSAPAAIDAIAPSPGRPCAFFDRDGVINVDLGFVHTPAEFRFVDGAPEAIRLLNEAGWLVIAVTNQSGIARGMFTQDEFFAFTRWIDGELARHGAHLDATYHCPHHPTEGVGEYLKACDCRKPAPGMFLSAIRDWQPDVARSVMIGDLPRDLEAGEAAGVRGVLYEGGDLVALVRCLIDDDIARAGSAGARSTTDESETA